MSPRSKLEAGTIFAGDFRVVRPLAEGGMGAVYVVEQISTGHQRALKVMLPEMADDERSRGRFAQEARVGAQIRSAHVVEVAAAGIDEATGTPWLAMELLDGEDLAAMMKRRGPLGVDEAREVFDQLGDALGRAHAAGVVHRDLKPENIFISVSRLRGVAFVVKVLDFGIAAILSDRKASVTVTSVVGSPLWMAPEQTNRGAKVGPPADVWALGLIAFHVLTGRYYWESANVPEDERSLGALFVDIMVNPLVAASQRAAALGVARPLPEGFDAWFARCVTREPTERFLDGAKAAAALSEVLAANVADPLAATALPMVSRAPAPAPAPSIPLAAAPRVTAPEESYVMGPTLTPSSRPSPPTPAPARPAARPARRGWIIGGVALLTATVAVGAVAIYDDDDPPAADAGATRDASAADAARLVAVDAGGDALAPANIAVALADANIAVALADATTDAPTTAALGEGQLDLRCHPRCRVTIDGDERGRSPHTYTLPAGDHALVLERGDVAIRRSVRIVAGETVETVVDFDEVTEAQPEPAATPTPVVAPASAPIAAPIAAPTAAPIVAPVVALPDRPSRAGLEEMMRPIEARARSCGGTGRVVLNIAFAGDGHMISASVEGSYANTPVGACIVRAATGARVAPFARATILVAQPISL